MKLLTLRDLFEAVEQIAAEQAAQAGGLHHIADTVDRIEELVRGCPRDNDQARRNAGAAGGGDCAS
jgi:hypothetical protein